MTAKKPSRVRILMMPYQEDEDSDPVGYSGPATVLTGLPQTIRRHELRLIVPLADSTIYEMSKALWNTPNVAHDNPSDQQFHASVMLGFANADEQAAFLESRILGSLSTELGRFVSALHAYQVAEALTFVQDGDILPHYQE